MEGQKTGPLLMCKREAGDGTKGDKDLLQTPWAPALDVPGHITLPLSPRRAGSPRGTHSLPIPPSGSASLLPLPSSHSLHPMNLPPGFCFPLLPFLPTFPISNLPLRLPPQSCPSQWYVTNLSLSLSCSESSMAPQCPQGQAGAPHSPGGPVCTTHPTVPISLLPRRLLGLMCFSCCLEALNNS